MLVRLRTKWVAKRGIVEMCRDTWRFEELLNCLEGIHYLDESKLRVYLDAYDTQALYQKTGFLLEHYREEVLLSQEFTKRSLLYR